MTLTGSLPDQTLVIVYVLLHSKPNISPPVYNIHNEAPKQNSYPPFGTSDMFKLLQRPLARPNGTDASK